MKIAIINEVYPPTVTGGAVVSRNIAEELVRRGHEILVLTTSDTGPEYKYIENRVRIVRLKAYKMPLNDQFKIALWPWNRFERALKDFNPDVLHIHSPGTFALMTLKWKKKIGTPVLATNHYIPDNTLLWLSFIEPLHPLLGALAWKYIIGLHNKYDYVTTPTKTAVDIIKSNGLKTEVEAISNGINAEIFKPQDRDEEFMNRLDLPLNRKIVLYTGRLDSEKRVDLLIQSADEILKRSGNYHFVIGGKGREQEKLIEMSKKLGIQKSITFIGFVAEEDLPKVYNLADIYVMPSPVELQSITTMEAMACGLPIIACEKGALYELVHDGKNGAIVEYENYKQQAEKIMEILENDQKKELYSRQSLEIIKEHKFKHVVDKIETLLLNLTRK